MNISSNYQQKSFDSKVNNEQLLTNPRFGMQKKL